jgi:hypothetical protein
MNEHTNYVNVPETPDPDSESGLKPEPTFNPQASAQPFAWAGPDEWRCRRRGPVSGRYEGEMTAPNAGRYVLDLRVDIDPRHANSPVMDKISGDFYQVFRFSWFGRTSTWRIYRESWIVDTPTVTWSRCQVEINGRVRFWQGVHPVTDVRIVIPWGTFLPAGPAQVTFTEIGGSGSTYSCGRQSDAFREVRLEVDVCQSVNTEPILPAYDTHTHPSRPASLPQRTLTIEEAYREAGIDLTINPARSIIDDTALADTNWLPSELHDAMEHYFSEMSGGWPKWHVWALLASGVFEDPADGPLPGVGGIMFDAAAGYGGAGQSPERQGCTVFRNHSWFNDLVVPPPTDNNQAAALRKFLYTYVHEIGHVFNFVHSWDKGRPDALSWMNYDWKYDRLPGNRSGSFWANFEFRFDDEELIHLRHGNRAAVIPGGDPWASGLHAESPAGAMADLLGEAPIELLVRSKGYFQFMEPVLIELRIRNTSDLPLELDTRLHPEFGGVTVYIRRPDGRILTYAPIMCKLATSDLKVLKPQPEAVQGEDRHSQNILLSYGSYGFYFDEPGEYLVRAVYQGAGDVLIPSNVHRVRIGHPLSPDEERSAQDFFSHETGLALYLNGSDSPFLAKGMQTLETMADRYQKTPLGGHLSLVLAQNLARPFHRIEEEKRVEVRPAKPEEALKLSAQAVEQQKRDDTTFQNITYHRLLRTRADLMADMGEKTEAKQELRKLIRYLEKRGVNQPVLEEIETYAKSL